MRWSCFLFLCTFGFGSINAENFSEPKSLLLVFLFLFKQPYVLTPLSLDHGGFTLEFRLVGDISYRCIKLSLFTIQSSCLPKAVKWKVFFQNVFL